MMLSPVNFYPASLKYLMLMVIRMLLLPGRGHASQPPGSANIADGFIVYGLMPNNKLLSELPAQRPLVSVDFDIDGSPTVHIDDQDASYHLAQHALNNAATAACDY